MTSTTTTKIAPKKITKPRAYPEKIQVLAHNVELSFDPDRMNKARMDESNADAIAFCFQDKQLILSDPEQGPDATADSIFHEIFHYAGYLTGLTNEFGLEAEEKIIMHLGSTILDTLRRNKELTLCLMGWDD